MRGIIQKAKKVGFLQSNLVIAVMAAWQ